MSKLLLPGLLLLGVVLAGCTTAAAPLPARTAQPVAATATPKANAGGPFVERASVGAGALKLTATPLKVGPVQFTVEAEGGLVPYEIQGIMASMGHGWDYDLTAANGKWSAKADLPMEGRWLVRVKAKDGAGQEQVGVFYVTVQAN